MPISGGTGCDSGTHVSDHQFDIRIATARRLLVDIRGFSIPENRVTFLFGESGIGKSLMAKALFGLLDSDELQASVNGMSYERYAAQRSARALREEGFFVFQEPSSHLNPLMTLSEQLREGDLAQFSGAAGILRELWGGEEPENLLPVYPKPHRPSGGEKQRMLLAMAFSKMDLRADLKAGEPGLFIFDEPTGSLDNRSRDIVLRMLMQRFEKRRCTILLITHDYSMISFVQNNFGALSREMVFREVTPSGGKLAVREFLPETYVSWVRGRRSDRRTAAGKVMLSLQSGLRVFDRTLMISRDETGQKECELEVRRGAITYLKAPSGMGKTTLVKMIMGLVRGSWMRVRLGSGWLTERTPRSTWQKHVWGKTITMAFQHADEALNLHSTVLDAFAGLPSRRAWTATRVAGALQELFEEEVSAAFLQRTVGTLSGGQKQRLNLLRCFVLDTDILILDEPLNGLDFTSTVKVVALLQRRQEEGKGILLISHNEEVFEALVPPEQTFYLHAAGLS